MYNLYVNMRTCKRLGTRVEFRSRLVQHGGRSFPVTHTNGPRKSSNVGRSPVKGHSINRIEYLKMTDMDSEVAKHLHADGATLIVFDVPEGTEFGIDYFSWNAGPRFKGVKMIPPGLHFIYYSAVNRGGQTAPRTGMFLYSKRQDILVLKWDATAEDVVEMATNEEEKEKYRQGIQRVVKVIGYALW